jgi:PAS domain S-box-containing protein
MSNVFRAGPVLDPTLEQLLGDGSETMTGVESRAKDLFPTDTPIVWECDASSFNFSFVSSRAEDLLGYPRQDWLEPLFWAKHVVHEEDRDEAVAYCTLATKKRRDHMFEYRAMSKDGRLVWLSDYVKVIPGPDGNPARLRGAMFDITPEKLGPRAGERHRQSPSRDELASV